MTSRLSSLLVRDGIVTVKRMERAFQRQVLSGGSLDTVLLEMGLVPEPRLIEYLALASGLPPASAADIESLDPRAADRCARPIADRFQTVPLGLEGDALRILARDPVNLRALEELADQLGLPIQPFVTPEYRFFVVFQRVFGGPLDPRFAALAEQLAVAGPAPVGRSRTVVIETTPPPVAVEPAGRRTRPISVSALKQHRDEIEHHGTRRPAAVVVPDPVPAPPVTPPSPAPPPASAIEPAPPAASRGAPAFSDDSGAIVAGEITAGEITAPSISAPEEQAVDVRPLGLGDAHAALDVATHRDEVFEILLRGVRAYTFYVGLLTVQGRAAIGRLAIIGDEPDQDGIESVLIPLDTPSAFRKAADDGSPYIGPVATADAAIDGMIRRMGGVLPPAALVMPIALRGRVVALVYGHRGADTLSITEMSELLPLASAAADALGRIIKGKKSSGRAGSESDGGAVPRVIDDDPPTGRMATTKAAAPAASNLATLLRKVYSSDAGEREAAKRGAVERAAEELADALRRHFPGRLDTARVAGVRRPAAEYGPILDLVVRIGEAAVPIIAAGFAHEDVDVRYYAAVRAAEVGAGRFHRQLVACLFDVDPDVRGIAIDELARQPPAEISPELEAVRLALLGNDLDRGRRAATALGELGDVGAVPILLELHGRGGALAQVATSALVRLAKQDFGGNPKKWRQWWERNKGRHRLEWMLEGLGHKDPEIRRISIEDLRRLTGESFGYHPALGKRERELARQRWLLWWHETGRRRFFRLSGGIETDRRRPDSLPPPNR